jgi:DNA repair ATPase RecN
MENTKTRVNYKENLAVAIKMLEEILMDAEDLQSEINRYDIEIQDVEHVIESLDFNASQGYALAKRLQEIRRERREIKNRLEMQTSMKSVLKAYKSGLKSTFEQTLKNVENLEKAQPIRKYKLRKLTDLEVFNKLGHQQRLSKNSN